MTPLQLDTYNKYKKQYSKDIVFMESKNAKANKAKLETYNNQKKEIKEMYSDSIEVKISKSIIVTFYKKR